MTGVQTVLFRSASVTKLVREKGKELSGSSIYSLFLKRRIQPCQHRAHPMWLYSGTSDATRCCKEEIPDEQLAVSARRLSKIADGNTFITEPAVEPFSLKNPLPAVISNTLVILNNCSFPILTFAPFLSGSPKVRMPSSQTRKWSAGA